MTVSSGPCERCGHPLRDDAKRGLVSLKTDRPTCPRGGPHKLRPAFSDDELSSFLRELS